MTKNPVSSEWSKPFTHTGIFYHSLLRNSRRKYERTL